ncbi:MAG: recombinase RecT, partial [Calditrichaeota bacterium]|nr:recombinase RecT [Calditrichota bacterium]
IALTAFRRTPKLGNCDPRSVFAAVIQASQLGLEPDTLGRSYLVPYGNECQFIPGWKGLVDLVNRAGNSTVWTGAVFEGDQFNYSLGDRPFIDHKPGDEFDQSKLTHVYAVGRVRNSDWPVIEVWTIARVEKHRDRYNKVGRNHYSYQNFEMYARKVVLLQVLKYMPASAEMSAAISLNDAAEVGKQHLTIDAAANNDWVPVEDDAVDEESTDSV